MVLNKLTYQISLKLFFAFLMTVGVFAQVDYEVSKNQMNFGTHAFCERPKDTIIVRNKQTSIGNLKLLVGETITGADQASFRITNPKIKDLDIPPYDGTNAVIYVVEFNPSVGTTGPKNAFLEIPTDLTASPIIKIPISGTSEKVDFILNPKPLDFGNIATGITYNDDFTLTLSTNLNVHISKIEKSKSELTLDLSGFNYNLTPSDFSRTLNVGINLAAQGSFTDTIKIYFDQPCDTVLALPVNALGLPSAISADLSYDFGLVSDCETKDTEITLTFSGVGSGKIESVGVISGSLANLFSISFPNTLPITLNSSNPTVKMKISYIGNGSDFGNANVTIPVNITVNANSSTINFNVFAEISEPKLIADKTVLDYQTIFAFSSKSLILNLNNNSKFDINLSGYKFTGNYPAFFDFIPVFSPTPIQKGTQLPLTIYFTPLLPKINATGKLTLYYSSNSCTDSVVIDLQGSTYDSGGLKFSFDNKLQYEVSPDENILTLPLTMMPTAGALLLNDSLEVKLSFHRSVFFPENVISTHNIRIDENSILGDYRIFRFTVFFSNHSVSPGSESKFADLKGIPLLGELKESIIELSSVNFKSGSKLVTVDSLMNTSLKLKICEAGGDRLLKVTNIPAGGVIQVDEIDNSKILLNCFLIEKGLNKISLFDLNGKILAFENFYSENFTSKKIEFDLSQATKSVYFVVLETVSEKYSIKFLK